MTVTQGFRPLGVNRFDVPLGILSMQVFSGSGIMGMEPLAGLGVENLTTLVIGNYGDELLAGTTRIPGPLRKLGPLLVGRQLDLIGLPFRDLEILTLKDKGHEHLFAVYVSKAFGTIAGNILAAMGASSLALYKLGDTEAVLGQVKIPVIFDNLVMRGIESSLISQGIEVITKRINYLGIPK